MICYPGDFGSSADVAAMLYSHDEVRCRHQREYHWLRQTLASAFTRHIRI